MELEKTASELYKEPEIREIEGDRVSGNALGLRRFNDSGKPDVIEIPTFSTFMKKVWRTYKGSGIREAYRETVRCLRDYILGHEIEVEGRKPKSYAEEAGLEAEYLKKAWKTNPAGIITHYIRGEAGDDSGLFKRLKSTLPVKEAYEGIRRHYGSDYIDRMTEMVKQALGLKPLRPAYEYSGG